MDVFKGKSFTVPFQYFIEYYERSCLGCARRFHSALLREFGRANGHSDYQGRFFSGRLHRFWNGVCHRSRENNFRGKINNYVVYFKSKSFT